MKKLKALLFAMILSVGFVFFTGCTEESDELVLPDNNEVLATGGETDPEGQTENPPQRK